MQTVVRFLSVAEQDISKAFSYYESERPGLGELFIGAVDDVIVNLSDFPSMYQKILGEMRRAILPRFPYALFYSYMKDEVVVIA